MPKVSVILTSYNHAKYLRESIESVLNQTYSDFELIIGDDASTDGSWDIIQSYTDPRIYAYRHETNREGIINELVLSGRASSDYIAIHSSDDIWEPKKLEKQVAFLDVHSDVGAVFTDVLVIGEESEPLADGTHPYQVVFDQPNRTRFEWLNYFFYRGNALCHPSVMIRRVCYEDCGVYRYGLLQLGDFDMWVRLCLKYEIYVLPERLMRLRVRSNAMNASGNRPEVRIRGPFEYFQVLENYKKISTSDDLQKIFPAIGKYIKPDGFDLGFALGMAAFEPGSSNGERLFGLTLIFEALNDPDRSSRIAALYGFTQKDFAGLSAKYDVFSVELLSHLTSQVQTLTSQVQILTSEIDEKDKSVQMLLEIQGSRAWKLVTAFREIQARLIPVKNRIK